MKPGSFGRCVLLALGLLLAPQAASAQAQFHLMEATIDGIHAELLSGRLTCVKLVQAYLDRIAAYDQKGPSLNALQNINPHALDEAADLDMRMKSTGLTGPLHCIPVVVKDEIDTKDMPTTYGSALFKTFRPQHNATVIDRLEKAGAIILAKGNMGEFASAYSGSAFGDCHNAYDPTRSPSGSSCGPAIAVTANFAAIGIGEDSAGSIRGPAAHGSLVGLRPTLALVSRAGMMPFAPTRDTIGPITRTVRDAAIVLDVIAGYDPADPVTADSYGKLPQSYTSFLVPNGLKGMRFGVFRHPMDKVDTSLPDYKETQAAIDRAVADLKAQGAEIVDNVDLPNFREIYDQAGGGDTYEAEGAMNAFLAAEKDPPVRTVKEIVDSPVVKPKAHNDLKQTLGHSTDEIGWLRELQGKEMVRVAMLRLMADQKLDALIYPTYDLAPAQVPVSTPGSNRRLASMVNFPAIALPGGFFKDGLPIGIEMIGRPFEEGRLLRAAYGYEQATRHRHPPATTPALAGEP